MASRIPYYGGLLVQAFLNARTVLYRHPADRAGYVAARDATPLRKTALFGGIAIDTIGGQYLGYYVTSTVQTKGYITIGCMLGGTALGAMYAPSQISFRAITVSASAPGLLIGAFWEGRLVILLPVACTDSTDTIQRPPIIIDTKNSFSQ